MISYYDIVLTLIPLTLFAPSTALTAVGTDLTVSISISAALSAILIAHTLFVRSPVPPSHQDTSINNNPTK